MNLEWRPSPAAHMWASHQVTREQANEAVNDPLGGYHYPTSRSQSGQTGRWVGYSPTRGDVLVVTLLPKVIPSAPDPDNPPNEWWGINGWKADATHRRIYRNREWTR